MHHLDSICLIVHALEGKWGRVFTTDLIVSETVTMLRYRISLDAALSFLNALRKSGISLLFMDEETYEEAVKVLTKYSDRKLSFTDSLTIVFSEKLGIDYLATFDERSFKNLIRNLVGKEYSKLIPESELDRILREMTLERTERSLDYREGVHEE